MKDFKLDKIVCHYPWSSLYISPNGDVKHCCATNITSLGNLSTSSFQEIWNGDLFQSVRNKVASGNFEGAFCNSNCQGLRTGDGYPWTKRAVGERAIEQNEENGILSFEKGETVVKHFPTQLHIEFTDNCNFRCIMCFYEFKPPYNVIPERAIAQILEASKWATHVILMGGEVFMNKSDLKFLEEFSYQEGTCMGFVTNASYLDKKTIDKLKKFKKIGMQISIDGTQKDIFEKIRRRGKWEVVDANIKQVVKTSIELKEDGYEWEIFLAYVVMKSNFHDLAHALGYAIELGVPIDFHPVKGFHLYDENIFVYKGAFAELESYEQVFIRAYQVLEDNKGIYPYSERVKLRLQDVENQLLLPKVNVKKPLISLLRFLIPGRNDKSSQGLSMKEWRVGHFFEIIYNLKNGKTSFRSTVSYFISKAFRRK